MDLATVGFIISLIAISLGAISLAGLCMVLYQWTKLRK